jgi:hypothetical protein
MDFEVVGDISGIETIATGNVDACENAMAGGGGASEKVSQKFGSHQAILSERSYTGTRLPASVDAK